ncbi:riboflavin synthase [Paenibacillus larvae]
MFTGIIEEIGTMRRIDRQGQALILTIGAKKILEDIHLGDSIAVNGVCLTVVAFQDQEFSVDVMPETFRSTNLAKLKTGSRVNLERAMQAGGRYGGHIVQGHVDGTAVVIGKDREENAVVYRFRPLTGRLTRYIIPKGSIMIDGISLTVVDTKEGTFSVSIIPHTLAETILNDKGPGDTVNIECDIIGKYIKHFLKVPDEPEGSGLKPNSLSETFLTENGFM